eukprot:Hpha_TRINITY_DN4689_c0_g1::TRINITY_DN4689_c0_g1_i1::g.97143::m.97143
MPEDKGSVEARRLLRHATGVFFFSTWVSGFVHYFGIMKQHGITEGQGSTSHVGGVMNAVMMFAVAGGMRELLLSTEERGELVTAVAHMGWANTLGYTIGALIGSRGLGLEKLRDAPPLALFLYAMVQLARALRLLWRGSRP